MNTLLKVLRAIVFPFRFLFLLGYAWLTNRWREAYLARRGAPQDAVIARSDDNPT
ncbi:MAG: hypothetical protein JXQ27_02550 [Acidobacteria bacterium]|nr:hypothetical protein [Acidobacteriota bacterium]